VRIKVGACGVCHTDFFAKYGGTSSVPPLRFRAQARVCERLSPFPHRICAPALLLPSLTLPFMTNSIYF
jgi:hypothetical protein